MRELFAEGYEVKDLYPYAVADESFLREVLG